MVKHTAAAASRIRAAVYSRVSTTEQTADNQIRALREHASRAGWEIVAEFTDSGISGTREKRPGLDALMADARRRKFDLIAVAALDRLGRNLRHLVTVLDECQHLKIGLVSLREALDLTSPIGRAMFALVGVLAEVERAWIVERTHAGLRRARAQGKRLGRPSAVQDPARLRRLLAAGNSFRAAARLLGISEGAVRLAVRRNPSLRAGSRTDVDLTEGERVEIPSAEAVRAAAQPADVPTGDVAVATRVGTERLLRPGYFIALSFGGVVVGGQLNVEQTPEPVDPVDQTKNILPEDERSVRTRDGLPFSGHFVTAGDQENCLRLPPVPDEVVSGSEICVQLGAYACTDGLVLNQGDTPALRLADHQVGTKVAEHSR